MNESRLVQRRKELMKRTNFTPDRITGLRKLLDAGGFWDWKLAREALEEIEQLQTENFALSEENKGWEELSQAAITDLKIDFEAALKHLYWALEFVENYWRGVEGGPFHPKELASARAFVEKHKC